MQYAALFQQRVLKFAEAKFMYFVLVAFVLHSFSYTNAHGRHIAPEYSDLPKQRLLIRITAQYIHTISQGQIDMDSAISIPCKIYGLSHLLPYNEGYDDGKEHPGTKMLDAGNLAAAQALLTTLHGEARIRLLADLASYFIFKPGSGKADLGRASTYVNEALALAQKASLQWRIEITSLKANLLQQYGRTDQSQKLFNELESLSRRSGNPIAYANALQRAGEVLHYGHPDRITKFEKALAIYLRMHRKEKEIEVLSLINIENFVAKRYDVAEVFLQKIIKRQAEINFRHRQCPFDALSWLSFRKGALANALLYSDKSLACVSSKADSAFIPFFCTRRALVYERLFNFEQAIFWYNKGLSNKTRNTRLFWYRSVIGKVGMLNNIGKAEEALEILQRTSNEYPPASYFEKMHFAYLLGMSYENTTDLNRAEIEYQTFLMMADKFPIEYIYDEFPAAFFKISSFYRTIGKTEMARKLLKKGNVFASTFDVYAKEDYYYNLYKIDSMEGRYLEAIKNRALSFKALDTAFSYDQRRRAEQLLMRYELDRKDKNIALLHNQTRLERIRSERAHRAKNITIASLLVSLTIIALLLNRYITRQRTNQKLAISQRELDRKNTVLETLDSAQNQLLRQKQWLTWELHQRVKNDLCTVTTLLDSQLACLQDDVAKRAVLDSLIRMNAISLVYRKVSQNENMPAVFVTGYIDELITYLRESFDEGSRVTFQQDVEILYLDVFRAVPLGLILTESIVNAVKHAFVDGREGIVSIQLKHENPGYLILRVTDNGVGFPPGLDLANHNSLGLDLMEGLSRQLHGLFQIRNDNGVQVTVRFQSGM